MEAAGPGFTEAEGFGDVVEALAFEVVATDEGGFVVGKLADGGIDDVEELRARDAKARRSEGES